MVFIRYLWTSVDKKRVLLMEFCRFAYGARTTPHMKELNKRSGKGSTSTFAESESNETNFLKLRHYIGRLGSHVKAAKILVAAAMRFPAFFDDFEIECLPSSIPAKSPPPMDELTTLNGIIVRMLKNENIIKVPLYQEALNTMDTKLQIYQKLKNEYKNPAFLPRVHAELILLEHFYKGEYDFVDGDKFIGCSKPACYCCYHYICAHPGNFVRPASHNKTYLAWRPPSPDIISDDGEESAMKHRRDIINKMVEIIRTDVLQQIEKQSGRRHTHPDSTTGITPSVAVDDPFGPSDSRLFTSRVSLTSPFM